MVVVDTDILSMFAKVNAISLLKQIFGEKVIMTPKTRDEISMPLEYGYKFPIKALSAIKTVSLSYKVLEEYEGLRKNSSLGKGELECIAYCKVEKHTFLTNDMKAREVAKKEGISVISLQAILKTLWQKRIRSKEEVRQLLEKIKEADNLEVSSTVEREIFG